MTPQWTGALGTALGRQVRGPGRRSGTLPWPCGLERSRCVEPATGPGALPTGGELLSDVRKVPLAGFQGQELQLSRKEHAFPPRPVLKLWFSHGLSPSHCLTLLPTLCPRLLLAQRKARRCKLRVAGCVPPVPPSQKPPQEVDPADLA